MANEKRARQDANRTQKLAQVAVEQKKVHNVEKRNKFLKIAAAVVALVVLVLLLNKCSSNNDSAADTTVAPATTLGAPTTVLQFASDKLNTKPVITIPSSPAPTKLVVNDVVVGNGATVEAGDTVLVQYVGMSWSTKKEFDSSWSRNAQPYEVIGVPNAPVIDGWNQGLLGMKVGGRRQLIIPPALAYGTAGNGDIKPNETLVFVIDTVRVVKAADVAKNTLANVAPTIAQ